MVENKSNRLHLQGVISGFLALAGYGLLGKPMVLAQEPPAASASGSTWFVSAPEKALVISALPEESDDRMMRLCARVDERGNRHLFWMVAGDARGTLFHGVWRRDAPPSQEAAAITALTTALDAGYSVTSGPGALVVAWDEAPGGAFRIQQWDPDRFAWNARVSLSIPRGRGPVAFLPERLLFWGAYDPVPFDVSSIDPSARASPSFQIHAATHRDRKSLYAAHLARDEQSKEGLGPAQRVLEQQLDSEASWVETAVYPDTDGTYSVFVNEVDAAGQPVLRQYKYTPDGNTSTAMVGCWPLFSRSAEWRVFPVDNSNIYYIFWTGPRRQDDWGTHSLFWSRSDTPWVPHVLAGDRHFKSGNPVAVLRSTDHGTAWGLVAWRDGTSGVALCRLLDGKFSAPVSLPIGTTSDVALALNQDRSGVLFVATRHELRALPFTAEYK